MFTGIVEGVGTLKSKRLSGGGVVFDLEADFEIDNPEEGESIAINGVCLTAYSISGNRFLADVSPETLSRTVLGDLVVGDTVNMERALKLSDRLGGHLVSGHVDCVAKVREVKPVGDFIVFSFSLSSEFDQYIIEKGSISINGVSLTVNSCSSGRFSVSIIPHTLKITALDCLKKGVAVNIEVDIIGKYVEKLLSVKSAGGQEGSTINAAFLSDNGFI